MLFIHHMSFSKLALAGLAGLLTAGPVLAQKAKPKPKATPTAKVLTPTAAPATGDDTKQFLRVTPEHPLAGQPISLSYSPAGTPLAGKAGIRAVVYYFEVANVRWIAQDVALQPGPKSGELTGRFTPPANVGMVAYKFVAADGTTDKHLDKGLLSGYFSLLNDAARPGIMAAGSYMGYGVARKPDFGYGIPQYFDKFNISNEALFLWMSQELRFHPDEGPALMPQFLTALKLQQPDSYQPRARHALALASSQPNLREADWLGCYDGYTNVLGDKAKADSLAQQINQRFPNGYLVRLAKYRAVQAIRDVPQKLAGWEAFLQAYPPEAAYQVPARYKIDYDRIYQEIILLRMGQKDYRAVATYTPQLSYAGLLNMYYKAVQVSIRPTMLTAAQALPNATLLIERIDQFRNQRPAEFAYLSPIEWQAHFDQTSNPGRIHYAGILAELNQPAKAMHYAETAQRIADFSNANLNDIQAGLLYAGGAASQAQLHQVLEASVHHNQASPRMLDWLRDSYLATHPGGTGYDQYLAGLQNQTAKTADRAEIVGKMFKKSIADFALRDLDGKLVRLSDQKGKTVVLDFWATWCIPCKASLPGMQLAQERFKNDPNVVFFFIDTEETEPDYQAKVRDFITTKGYPFRVLFDEKAPGGKTLDATFSKYSKQYGRTGIPQKMVIDPKGNLRFLIVGYNGSPSALADEIETMIDAARTAD
jgi:peroxiredoxin